MPSIDFVIKMATDIYGNHNPKIDQVIRHALVERINGFCAGANFDFLHVHPSPWMMAYVEENKPVASFSAVFAKNFCAPGWFYTTDGQKEYEVGAPLMVTSENIMSGTSWINHLVGHVDCIKSFDSSGCQQGELGVLTPEQYPAFLDGSITTTGTPEVALVNETPFGTSLYLYPYPTEEVLYAISYKVAKFPCPENGNDSNPFIEAFPELAVQFGVQILAEHFNDMQRLQMLEVMLYGNPGLPNSTGLIHKVLTGERQKNTPPPGHVGMYGSRIEAQGKLQSGVHYNSGGGYYTTRRW